MKLATLCYVREAGKTLMLQRIKKPGDMHFGKWNGLGGKFEPGESPDECARREILEESGLRVNKLLLKGVLTFPSFSQNEDWYAFVFVAGDVDGQFIESSEGNLAWIPDQDLLSLTLWEGDRIFIPWLDGEKFFSGKFVYSEGSLESYEVAFYDQGEV